MRLYITSVNDCLSRNIASPEGTTKMAKAVVLKVFFIFLTYKRKRCQFLPKRNHKYKIATRCVGPLPEYGSCVF